MSDTIVKLFSKWIESFTKTVSLDGIFIFGLILIIISFVSLTAYKLASFDFDVLISSRNVIKFMRLPKSKRLYGSLNYYMRCFPTNVSKAWDKYFLEREGKPSQFLTNEVALSYGIFESGIKSVLPLVVAFSTLLNLVFALEYKKLPLSTNLILPIVTLSFGIVSVIILDMFFNITKRISAKKYSEMVHILDFHSLNDFANFLTPKLKSVKGVEKLPCALPIHFDAEKFASIPVENFQKSSTYNDINSYANIKSLLAEQPDNDANSILDTQVQPYRPEAVNVQESFTERVLNADKSTKELESLAAALTLAKTEKNSDEQTLNDAINNLMRTIACDDSPLPSVASGLDPVALK